MDASCDELQRDRHVLTMQGNRSGAALRVDTSSGIRTAYARTPSRDAWIATTNAGNAAPIHTGGNVSGLTAPVPFTGDAGNREAVAAYRADEWPEGLENTRDEWAQVLGNPAALTARAARELAGAFQHPRARDCMMTDVITGAPDQFTSVMLGLPARPDWARVDTAQEVAFELMKATPEGQRAPMLCLIGWLEWLKGRSSFASRYLKLALDDAPDYRLAVLLADHISRGLVAECTRTPDAQRLDHSL